MDLADFFEQGGALMWAILVASVVGVAVFLERLWSLQRSKVLPGAFVDRIRGLVSKDKLSEAQILCEENGSSVAMLMVGALRAYAGGKERAQIKEAVEEVGNREVAHLDRNVEVVGTVASITPLMGLLGTVIGMIQVFQNFVESYNQGVVGPDTFAQGIWQALITTAFGLTVAIPMLVAYKFLLGRNDRLIVAMEEDAMGLVDLLEDARHRSPVEEVAVSRRRRRARKAARAAREEAEAEAQAELDDDELDDDELDDDAEERDR